MIKKYPEIKNLFGVDLSFKYVVIAQVLFQILMAYLIKGIIWINQQNFKHLIRELTFNNIEKFFQKINKN